MDVSVLVWLAVPVLATVLAVVAVPHLQRRRARPLTPAQRADRLRLALSRDQGRSPR